MRSRRPSWRWWLYGDGGALVPALRSFSKQLCLAIARILAFPAACLAGFGRWHEPFVFFAQVVAIIPGTVGSYFRVAYYSLTLEQMGPDCHMGFGTFFAHSKASLGARVGLGAYCILGQVDIGEGTLIASHSQVLSGTRQHQRAEAGTLTDEGRKFRRISIGPHCWIGAGAIVVADIGAKATVGPGSVVTQDVPAGASVSGNPARNFSMVVKPVG